MISVATTTDLSDDGLMATVKQGIKTAPRQWWVHLRKYWKRDFWKRERKAGKQGCRHFFPPAC